MSRRPLTLFVTVILIVGSFLLPRSIHAEDKSDQCASGTFTCSCNAATSTASSDTASASSCDTYCSTKSSVTFSYGCKLSDGTPYTVSQGNVGSTTTTGTDTAVTQTADKNLLVPTLNVEIPGLEFTDPTYSGGGNSLVSSNFIAEYINAIYVWILSAGALIAVVMMMIGGLQYVLARGKSQYIEKAKTRITNAITGMVLLLAAYNIAYLIDPNIVSLETIAIAVVQPIITEDTAGDIGPLSLPDPKGGTNGVQYFNQRLYQDVYGAKCSGKPTIAKSGCGPTSAAMVLSFYGLSTDPPRVAASFESSGYRVCNAGTAFEAFSRADIVVNNGFTSEEIGLSQHSKIESLLKEKKPLIVSVGKSRFTRHGHFMVLTGIAGNGDFMLNDPNSGYQSVSKSELYSIATHIFYLHKK